MRNGAASTFQVENTNKLAGLEANLTTAAIAMVLLLFLLAVFVVVKSAPQQEGKEYIAAARFVRVGFLQSAFSCAIPRGSFMAPKKGENLGRKFPNALRGIPRQLGR